MGGGGIVENDLEDLVAEEVCQTAGGAADGCMGRGDRVCYRWCVCTLLFNWAEETGSGVPWLGRAYVRDAGVLVAFRGSDVLSSGSIRAMDEFMAVVCGDGVSIRAPGALGPRILLEVGVHGEVADESGAGGRLCCFVVHGCLTTAA